MSDPSPFSPDQPNIRLLALAGVPPSGFVAAVRDLERIRQHFPFEALSRYSAVVKNLTPFISHVNAILTETNKAKGR